MGADLDTRAWDRYMERFPDRAADFRPAADELHEEVLRQSLAQSGGIHVHTGRLRRSILDPHSPDHVFIAQPRRVVVYSRDPASVFNPDQIPSIDSGPLMRIVADYVIEDDEE